MNQTERHIVLVDLDDTIYDRTPHRLAFALERAEGHPVLDSLPATTWAEHLRTVRAMAPMFTALGFPSVRFREDRRFFLAAMMLLFAPLPDVERAWGVSRESLRASRRTVGRFWDGLEFGPTGSWQAYLVRRLTFARALAEDGAAELQGCLSRLMDHALTAELAERLADTAPWRPRRGFATWWSELSGAGVHCYVASEGDEQEQAAKLGRLGLDDLRQVLLTSGRAASPLDTSDLEREANAEFSRAGSAMDDAAWRRFRSPSPDGLDSDRLAAECGVDMVELAAARWVLETFSGKGPGYYARVVHAVVASPSDPRDALDDFAIVGEDVWSRTSVRVAMLGNYHAKDVVPVQQLLGPDGVWTGLLDMGAHRGHQHGDAEYRASQTFSSWERAMRFVPAEIPWDRVRPARVVRPHFDSVTTDLVERASQRSRFRVLPQLSAFLRR